jgi:outer membrane lipoprotein-sorting protein
MKQFQYAVLTVGFMLAVGAPARADDAADAKALVEKAVKAHGGQDKLDKLPGVSVKFKGTFHGMGDGIAMSGEISSQGPDKQRIDIEVEAGGQKLPILIITNGDKGWSKIIKEVKELGKDELAEAKEQAYAAWVVTLAPLKDKQFTFATTGEIKVEKRTALGVKVSSKGHRDVDLYFDKETGMLVKSETRVKDDMSGQEVTEESFPGDYKDVQGTKQPMKFTVKRNGKLHVEGEATEIKLSEKLDASLFAKPE